MQGSEIIGDLVMKWPELLGYAAEFCTLVST
jgi:hypothetical protein